MMPLSCGGSTCTPPAQYTFTALSLGGLWLAVTMIPQVLPVCRTAKESSGVLRKPRRKKMRKPAASSTSAQSRAKCSERWRVS